MPAEPAAARRQLNNPPRRVLEDGERRLGKRQKMIDAILAALPRQLDEPPLEVNLVPGKRADLLAAAGGQNEQAANTRIVGGIVGRRGDSVFTQKVKTPRLALHAIEAIKGELTIWQLGPKYVALHAFPQTRKNR